LVFIKTCMPIVSRLKTYLTNISQWCKKNNKIISATIQSSRAFTLIEILMVMVVVSIIFVVGGRSVGVSVDARKYMKSLDTMITIRRALIGDERFLNSGTPADWGHFGLQGSFPGPEVALNRDGTNFTQGVPVTALANFLPPIPIPASAGTTTQHPYQTDQWGNPFQYQLYTDPTGGNPTPTGDEAYNWFVDGNGDIYAIVDILCTGSNGTKEASVLDGGPPPVPPFLDEDMHIMIRRDLYEEN